MCHTPTTSTWSKWSTKSLFPKYSAIWEKQRKAERKTVTPPPRLQEFGSYFWELEELHTNCTPPYTQEVPCNDYIIEATYMSMAAGLLKYPERKEGKHSETDCYFTLLNTCIYNKCIWLKTQYIQVQMTTLPTTFTFLCYNNLVVLGLRSYHLM